MPEFSPASPADDSLPLWLGRRRLGPFFDSLNCIAQYIMAKSTKPTEEAYAELQQAYDHYNATLFAGQLPACLITFQRQKRTFGYFSKDRFGRRDGLKTDEIALNPEYFAVVPMIEVLQTLAHEMTHLWQEHFGKPSRACYHNMQWAEKMESIGLMPSNTGMPGGKKVGQSMEDYVITGGRFEQATKTLLSSGFAISWLDRFPAPPPARLVAIRAPAFVPVLTSCAGSADHSPDEGDDELDSGEESADGLAAAWASPVAVQPGIIDHQKTGNRSNRNKYTCPCCAINVWGKPGLRMRCGDCDEPLQEAGCVELEEQDQ